MPLQVSAALGRFFAYSHCEPPCLTTTNAAPTVPHRITVFGLKLYSLYVSNDQTIALRPATAADTDFLLGVYASTRAMELAFTAGQQSKKAACCVQQFRAQSPHCQNYY
jgi:hypothetical protein